VGFDVRAAALTALLVRAGGGCPRGLLGGMEHESPRAERDVVVISLVFRWFSRGAGEY
jgi:hypothetical protein